MFLLKKSTGIGESVERELENTEDNEGIQIKCDITLMKNQRFAHLSNAILMQTTIKIIITSPWKVPD